MINREAANVEEIIINDILFNDLDLSEIGFNKDDVSSETELFGESGLQLDSLAALEVAVAIQQKFGFKIEPLDREFFEKYCSTIGVLANYVAGRIAEKN